jgi:hypothetical protein
MIINKYSNLIASTISFDSVATRIAAAGQTFTHLVAVTLLPSRPIRSFHIESIGIIATYHDTVTGLMVDGWLVADFNFNGFTGNNNYQPVFTLNNNALEQNDCPIVVRSGFSNEISCNYDVDIDPTSRILGQIALTGRLIANAVNIVQCFPELIIRGSYSSV